MGERPDPGSFLTICSAGTWPQMETCAWEVLPGGRQGDHEPAACPGCQEGQWDPGVHEEECGQQGEGGSPTPLHCPGEAPSAVLGPVLGSPVLGR